MSGPYLILRNVATHVPRRYTFHGEKLAKHEAPGALLLFDDRWCGEHDGFDPILDSVVLEHGQPLHLVLRREELPPLHEFLFHVLVTHDLATPRTRAVDKSSSVPGIGRTEGAICAPVCAKSHKLFQP